MGQIAQQLASSSQAQGTLPSATVTNPREHNNVNSVTTREILVSDMRCRRDGGDLGKRTTVGVVTNNAGGFGAATSGRPGLVGNNLKDSLFPPFFGAEEDSEEDREADQFSMLNEPFGQYGVQPPNKEIQLLAEKIRALESHATPGNKKKGQHEKNFEKFLELFKKLEINIPLLEALEQMPTYAKFMKDIISKRRVTDTNQIILTETCSAILQGIKILIKKKDRGAVTIPCIIGDRSFNKALIDLGASVSLMSLSIYKKLGIGVVQNTRMTLQFTGHSVKKPYGIVEDVLVKIDKFVFPVDFVILEMPIDKEIPLILGRPFLETGRCFINIEEGTMTLKVYDEELKSDVRNTMRYKNDICTSHTIEVLDQVTTYDNPLHTPQSPLERVLSLSIFESDKEVDDGESEVLALLDAQTPWKGSRPRRWEDLRIPQSSEENEEPKKETELKQLPDNLKYVFLELEGKCPAIINSSLQNIQEEKLIQVLKKYKNAIGWAIEDLKGISPTVCMHKILMEDDHKPVVQPQRRLNPAIKEVVRKEVVKLLDAGLIYPISDSLWVIPVHVVPKKGGTTVIRNEKNKLIPTRTITGWRVCIDYRRLNTTTRKDHFPFPFIDQMLERLSGHDYYCFLDGYSGYNQIVVAPKDQEKTAFTCPYGVFAYRRMPFWLCNAPATFQWCQKPNLILNWEKCHFMVREGIVFGHKISYKGIEVDQAKVEVISKLPPSVNEKDIRSFLGHAGFYRRKYLLGSKVVVYTNHVTLKYLFAKQDSKPRILRWILLLQEFDVEIRDKRGCENTVADHLSHMSPIEEIEEKRPIKDEFAGEHILAVIGIPWFVDYANYLVGGIIPNDFDSNKKKKFVHDCRFYLWNDPFLYKRGVDGLVRRCVPEEEQTDVLRACHDSDYGGHFSGDRTAAKVLQSDFMGPFPPSCGKNYILVAVDYVSKWVEVLALPTNDAKVVVTFLKNNIFSRFGVPRALISDEGTHFLNKLMENLLKKFNVKHKITTPYQPQMSGH
ncbi:uncharacterized protein LOC127080012 [Lathyrus oleraceus]|uniref:uncharacterized protein LOC127080012 n=1 Tax=Pisum sativum TaxID=3888 RepID=UPI0021D293FF|nr:uncharacterized protein LOC127080012 [Pisum sativum]